MQQGKYILQEFLRDYKSGRTSPAIRHREASDFWICVKGTTNYQLLFTKIDRFNFEAVRAAFRIPEEYLKQLKFKRVPTATFCNGDSKRTSASA